MDNRRRPDLLSNLPLDIIEKILMLLPIRDAIRTSILSSKWRYRWVSLPRLVFDEDSMVFPDEDDEFSDESDEFFEDPRLKIFITQTLFRHQGPIHKFRLRFTDMDSCPKTDEWLLFLSRKDVKELDLTIFKRGDFYEEMDGFCLPSCLYSCQNLTNLKLLGCRFSPPPPNFKGFLCLRSLTLKLLDVPSATIESFIANCPLLEKLKCFDSGRSNLRISSPNLKHANLDGTYKEISLCAPLLAKLIVALQDIGGSTYSVEELPGTHLVCNYTKFLAGFTNLDTLIGIGSFTKYLSIGIEHCHQPLVFHHLEFIKLRCVNFDDMNEILVVVRLIMDATNLCYLEIESFPDKKGASKTPQIQFWDSECPKNYTFNNLESVKMSGLTGAQHEIKFILFLLQSSPVLETLIIEPVPTIQQELLELIYEWLCCCGVYTNADIFFKK